MKIDASKSRFHQREDAQTEYNAEELEHLQAVLRRLRFLEAQERIRGTNIAEGNGGAIMARNEARALEWVLNELEFLETRERAAR